MSDVEYINEALRPLAVEITTLMPDPRNARKHDRRNLDATRDSLRMNGQTKPIVVWDQTPEQGGQRVIVAGNGTTDAAKELGWTHVAANVRPFESVEAAQTYALQDNRTAELAEWDREILAETLRTLDDFDADLLGDVGFSDVELREFMVVSSELSAFEKPDVTPPDGVRSNTKSGVVKDGNWLYVEYYEQDDLYAEITEMLASNKLMRKGHSHEISAEAFAAVLREYHANHKEDVSDDGKDETG